MQYKRLTPKLRKGIIEKLNDKIDALKEDGGYAAKLQVEDLKKTKEMIKGLPDGYPLPMKEGI